MLETKDKPVPQKRTRRKEARPGEIIEAGIAEFAEHGFERARLDRIAKAAGVAKGTIYLYFENKEALFMAAVEEHVVSVMAETEADVAFDKNSSTAEMFRRLLDRLYARTSSDELLAIMRILIAEGYRFPNLVKMYHEVTIERGVKVLKSILGRGRTLGDIKPSVLEDVPEVIIAPVIFFCVNRIIFDEVRRLDRETFVDAHLQLILAALGLSDHVGEAS